MRRESIDTRVNGGQEVGEISVLGVREMSRGKYQI